MARQKRGSRTLEKAQRRLASLISIDPKIVLDSTSAQEYAKTIEALRQKIEAYNATLSTVDEMYHEITDGERSLADYSEQVLLGVAVRFGKNSNEYERAGGVRKRDRKRPTRQLATAAG